MYRNWVLQVSISVELNPKDKAVILLIRFLKAERNVGQGVLQNSYGRMGKMGLSPDIELLFYRSHHCLFSLPPWPGAGSAKFSKLRGLMTNCTR